MYTIMSIDTIDIDMGLILYYSKQLNLRNNKDINECLRSYHSYYNNNGSEEHLLNLMYKCNKQIKNKSPSKSLFKDVPKEKVLTVKKGMFGGGDNVLEQREESTHRQLQELQLMMARQSVELNERLTAMAGQLATLADGQHIVPPQNEETNQQLRQLVRNQAYLNRGDLLQRSIWDIEPERVPEWFKLQLGKVMRQIVVSPLTAFIFICWEIPMTLIVRPIRKAVRYLGETIEIVWGIMLIGVIGTTIVNYWVNMDDEDRERVISSVRSVVGYPLDLTLEFISFIYDKAFRDFIELLSWCGSMILLSIRNFGESMVRNTLHGLNPSNWWNNPSRQPTLMPDGNFTENQPTSAPTMSYLVPNVSMPNMSMPRMSVPAIIPALGNSLSECFPDNLGKYFFGSIR